MSPAHDRGLGRGLGALIPRASAGLREIPVDAIRPNPWQPRTHFDENELGELAQSIREHGVLQPVLVSQQADGSFQLITGERRWRAVQLAGLPTVPAMVKEATPQASLEMALVENIQRRDLNPLEEAHAFRQLIEEHGLTQEQLAQRIGKSRVAVTNTLRLLHLPDAVRQTLADGAISEGHARAILTADGEARRIRLLERVLADHLSVRDTDAQARHCLGSIAGMQFAQDVLHVLFDRAFGHDQALGDLTVARPECDQLEYFLLAHGQRRLGPLGLDRRRLRLNWRPFEVAEDL